MARKLVFIPFSEGNSRLVMPTTWGDEFVLADPEYFDGKADSGVVLQLGQGGYSGWKGVTKDDVFCADTAGYQAALKSLTDTPGPNSTAAPPVANVVSLATSSSVLFRYRSSEEPFTLNARVPTALGRIGPTFRTVTRPWSLR